MGYTCSCLCSLLLAPTKWKSYCVRPVSRSRRRLNRRLNRRRATYSTELFSKTSAWILMKLCREVYGVKVQCHYYISLWLVENSENGGKFKCPNMVKSPISPKIWPIDTPILLGTYSKSCMTFLLMTLKMTFDLLFKVKCQKCCFSTYSRELFSKTSSQILIKLCREVYGVKVQCHYYISLWLVENSENGGKFKCPNMVKSPISPKIWPIDTPILLGTYSKSCMTFLLMTLKMTFDLLFKVKCQKCCFCV